MGKCPWCGADVLILRHTFNGNSIAVDIDPAPDGYLRINEMTGQYQGVARPGRQPRIGLYKPHAATCPNLHRTDSSTEGKT